MTKRTPRRGRSADDGSQPAPAARAAAKATPREQADIRDGTAAATATPSNSDLIFRNIVQGLYRGTYVPGQRLVEADLTRIGGVGRGTVREALNRLAAEDIVTLSRYRGATIRSLSRAEMQDMLDVLETMIGMAARLAARGIAAGDNRARFVESYDALMAFSDRPDTFELLQARNRFYRALAKVGGNGELQRLLGRVHVHLLRIQLRSLGGEPPSERFADYRRIGEAVLAGDGRRAEAAARRHVRATGDVLRRAPVPDASDDLDFL